MSSIPFHVSHPHVGVGPGLNGHIVVTNRRDGAFWWEEHYGAGGPEVKGQQGPFASRVTARVNACHVLGVPYRVIRVGGQL